MDDSDLIERLKEQEAKLQLSGFDELEAFALATSIRERAVREDLPLVCEVKTWDRPLAYFAMPGSSASNVDWVRRKSLVVQRWARSSYRMLIEQKRVRVLEPNWGLPPTDYALSGGSFPLRIKGGPVIGALTISGLHEHDDHELAAEALCERLGLDWSDFVLPRPAA